MEQILENDEKAGQCRPVKPWVGSMEKIPMHPDDFNALHAWITARRFCETAVEKNLGVRPVSSWMNG
jgi:hypothetical protein